MRATFSTLTSILTSTLVFALTLAVAVSAVSPNALAQGTSAEKPPSGGPRRQLGTIIYAGLGGAVLGLSTLSFYGRPQDKLANIAIGFAVGVIGGTIAVTYSAATNPDEFYGSGVEIEKILGPAPSPMVIANRNADESSPAFSTSYELATF